MELSKYFKSIIDEDKCEVVICDINHKIIYMNPAACEKYRKQGGAALVGSNLLDCHNDKSGQIIIKVVDWFMSDKMHNRIYTFHSEKENKDVYMVALRDEAGELIGYYEKHEYRNRESQLLYNFE